jgi:acyl-CoA thioesterase
MQRKSTKGFGGEFVFRQSYSAAKSLTAENPFTISAVADFLRPAVCLGIKN